MKTIEIRKCPVCGQEPRIDRVPYKSDHVDFETMYVECKECGHGYMKVRPTDEEYHEMYFGGKYREWLSNGQPKINDWLSDHNRCMRAVGYLVQAKSQGLINMTQVLDFGSGLGIIAYLLKVNFNLKVEVVEPNTEWRKYVEQEGIKGYNSIEEVTNRYDMIVVSHVLEHMTDPITTMLQLGDKLAAAGSLYIEVPIFSPSLFHPQVFTTRSLQWLAEYTGYRLTGRGELNFQGEKNDSHYLFCSRSEV